jgi:hypothetical protein
MHWIPEAKVGDKFRWMSSGVICRITAFKDNGIQMEFIYETGKNKGQWGYTLLPQDVELLTVLDELAEIEPD